MSLDAEIREAVRAEFLAQLPTLRDQIVAGVVAAMRADADQEWMSQAEFGRCKGWSADTVARKIASGELEVQELGRRPVLKQDGSPVLNRDGSPRFRRSLRVRLARRPSDAEIAAISAEARR